MTERKRIYTNRLWHALWLLWIGLLAAAYVMHTDWLYVVCIGYFAVFEAWAIIRPRKGDTFSEQVWAFDHRRHARFGLTLGAVGYLGVNLFRLALEVVYEEALEDYYHALKASSAGVFIVGGMSWLILHFTLEGRDG